MIGRRWALALTAVMSLSACGAGGAVGDRPPTLPELRDQARTVLARYDKAVGEVQAARRFVPVGEPTEWTGELEPANESIKPALTAGHLVPAGPLPVTSRRTGTITWTDGVSRSVAVIPAEEALAAHRHKGDAGCGGCPPVTVTDARPVTMQVDTTRGAATVPAWEYTLKDTALRVRYPAVGGSDVVTVTAPPWDPDASLAGETIDAATTTALTSKRLTVSFVGPHDPASEPCGADYHAEAIESSNAVVVLVVVERRHNDGNETCTMIGFTRTETVSLAQPLGERVVLDARQGAPVSVRVTD
ncbi:hypothetical protein EV385_5003 [Krasilnikovia cinnamomea]|uniref:Lipoprotein n=1 Tax=Krasilnikovia cinnamomea TaxID=349313 RepID=A0A4Q7ZPV6_9ACTN|nr:hypothetical protein [Krasilnikovia cinnamomea]RZU53118.1 hypothetical protein EV385_5003 [Krasilnikovia cinnamomea]